MDNNDLTTDNLIKAVNRRAYYMQYGLYLSSKEAIRADFRTAAYKRQFPGRTLLQARRYAAMCCLSERRHHDGKTY